VLAPESVQQSDRKNQRGACGAASANVKVLQKMLGHSSASMTLDRYADLFDADDVSVSDTVNAQIIKRVGSDVWSVGRAE